MTAAASPANRHRVRPIPGVFAFLHGAMLVTAAVSFTWAGLARDPGRGEFPLIVLFHVIITLAWLAVAFVQVLLPSIGKTALHRRLGWAALAVAGINAISFAQITFYGVRVRAPAPPPLPPEGFAALHLFELLQFAGWITLGVLLRKRDVEAHRRLMYYGSAAIMISALGRMPLPPAITLPVSSAGLLFFTLAPVAYDLVVRRRPHWTSVVCATVTMLWVHPANAIGVSPEWVSLMRALVD